MKDNMSEDRPSIPESVATAERKIFVPPPHREPAHHTPQHHESAGIPEPKNAQPGIGFLQEIGLVRPDVAQIDPRRESPLTSKGAQEQESFIGKRPDAGIKPPTPEQVAEFEDALITRKFGGMDVLEETTSGGIRALNLKDPKTGKTSHWRLQQIERPVGAGIVPEFPAGLANLDALRNYVVENWILAGEVEPWGIDKDQIESITNRINGYGIPGIGAREKRNLVLEVEGRLNLAAANYWIASQGDAGEFAKYFAQMNAERINAIRDEALGPAGLAAIHQMELADVIGPGAFFRFTGGTYQIQENAIIAGIEAIDHQGPEAAEIKYDIVKSLFNTSGMSTFYTGPMEPVLDPAGNVMFNAAGEPLPGPLLEPQFMAASVQVNQIVVGGRATYDIINPPQVTDTPITPDNLRNDPMLIYDRNEAYWEEKRLYRIQERDAGRQVYFAPAGENQATLKRTFYPAEELARRGREGDPTGKAESLYYAAELYVMPLPFMQGANSLEDFIGPMHVQASNHRLPNFNPSAFSESLVKKGRTFRYAHRVRDAATTFNEMVRYLNEPIKGGPTTSTEGLGDDLANLTKVVDEMGKYLGSFSPNIRSFATSRILIATMEYIQGNFADRWREFRKTARFKLQTMNAIINWSFFKPYMSDLWRRQTLESVGASGVTAADTTIQNIDTGKAVVNTAGPIGEALFKAITRK